MENTSDRLMLQPRNAVVAAAWIVALLPSSLPGKVALHSQENEDDHNE
ncbi:hypothetical protein IIA29_12560 [candidate division KSB1 bacterium]|nr:hypothetical protein [candidate division KSB1 bacterium]